MQNWNGRINVKAVLLNYPSELWPLDWDMDKANALRLELESRLGATSCETTRRLARLAESSHSTREDKADEIPF